MKQGKLVEERKALTRFVLRHSGDKQRARQCKKHDVLELMTASQARAALLSDEELTVTRQWLAEICDDLKVPRRRERGPRRKPAGEKQASARHRYDTWFSVVVSDPAKHEEYKERKRREYQDRKRRNGGTAIPDARPSPVSESS